ncbi:MAG: oligosaccharide flippase family protein [Calditrichia bacterium]
MLRSKHSKNAIFLFSGDIAARAVGFLITVYLARILGKADFGAMNIGLTLLTYALLFSNCGLNIFGTRELSATDDPNSPFATRLLLTRLGLSLFFFIGLYLAIPYSGLSDELIPLLRLYLFYLFPAAIWLDWFFQARQQMGSIMLGRLAGMLVYLTLVLLLVHSSADLLNTAIAYVSGGVMASVFFLAAYYKLGYRFHWPKEGLQPVTMLRNSFVLGIATLASQLVLQFPVLYLGWTATLEEVGLFSAAFKLLVMLLIFDRVFYTIFFPAVSKQAANAPEKLAETLNRLLRLAAVFSVSAGFTAIVLAEPLIGLIFGGPYLEAVPLFQFLTGYFVLTMMNSVVGYTLLALKREKQYTRAFVIAMTLFFLLLLLWPGKISAHAVAASLMFYQLLALFLMTLDLRKLVAVPWLRGIVLPVAALLACLAVYTYVDGIMQWLLLPIAIAVFITAGGIDREDMDYVKRTLG